MLKQFTREVARISARNLRKSGYNSSVVDLGKHLIGINRWRVSYGEKLPNPSHKRGVKKVSKVSNKGFDIRKVTTGRTCFDVFYNGEFLLRRDTKIAAYEDGLQLAHKAKLPVATLQYK